MHRRTDTQTYRHTDTQTHICIDTQTDRHTDTQTHRHTDTHTDRHTDTQTRRQKSGPDKCTSASRTKMCNHTKCSVYTTPRMDGLKLPSLAVNGQLQLLRAKTSYLLQTQFMQQTRLRSCYSAICRNRAPKRGKAFAGDDFATARALIQSRPISGSRTDRSGDETGNQISALRQQEPISGFWKLFTLADLK